MLKALSACLLLAVLLSPAFSAFAQDGYVVKADSGTVYLDITRSSENARVGAEFVVYEEGEELVNPVTHESLGKMHAESATGKITEVQSKYAVGAIVVSSGAVKSGQLFKWTSVPPPTVVTGREKIIWKSKPLNYEAISMALGDFDGSGGEIAAATEKEVKVYGFDAGNLSEKYSWKPSGAYRIITVDATDIKGAGRAQLFVSLYDSSSSSFQTAVLELKSPAKELERTATLGWLSRSVTLPSGERRLYGQRFYASGDFKASAVHQVVLKDGEFALSEHSIDSPRFDSVYGFNILEESGGKIKTLVFTTDSNRLRAQFEKRGSYVETDTLYGKTPNVLRITEQVLQFYPRVAAVKGVDSTMLYAPANITKEGLLSETFGRYKDATMTALRWTGIAFEPAGETVMDGYVPDMDSGFINALGGGIFAAVVGTDSTTVIKMVRY